VAAEQGVVIWRSDVKDRDVMTDLTLEEAAVRLGRNRELVRMWVAAGRLTGRKRADRWFIRASDLSRFMKREPIRRTWSLEAHKRVARNWATRRGNA